MGTVGPPATQQQASAPASGQRSWNHIYAQQQPWVQQEIGVRENEIRSLKAQLSSMQPPFRPTSELAGICQNQCAEWPILAILYQDRALMLLLVLSRNQTSITMASSTQLTILACPMICLGMLRFPSGMGKIQPQP